MDIIALPRIGYNCARYPNRRVVLPLFSHTLDFLPKYNAQIKLMERYPYFTFYNLFH